MKIQNIKTRHFKPPRDDIKDLLATIAPHIREGSVVAISSKVLSICEGSCVDIDSVNLKDLISNESNRIISFAKKRPTLTRKNDMLVEYGGVDNSKSSGYYILLPRKPYKSAFIIWKKLRRMRGIKQLGVIITDSHSAPFRKGSVGMAVAGYGFNPVNYFYPGVTSNLRAKKTQSITKMADALDSLAAAATMEMGEGSDHTPVAVIDGVHHLAFFKKRYRPSVVRRFMYVRPENDVYQKLL